MKVFGVIGYPIEHSISPILHNTIYNVTKKDASYVAFKVHPDNLQEAVQGIRALGISGINVTIPHKENVIKYLDYVSEGAKAIGAVNTVVYDEGKLKGYNTDTFGLVRAIEDMGFLVANKRILILGAGGAAKAAGYGMFKNKASLVAFMNRTESKAISLLEKFNLELGTDIFTVISPQNMGSEEFNREFQSFDLIINTTSVGMSPNAGQMPISDEVRFREGQFVYDAIYKPAETLLLKKAKDEGCVIANGLGMLFYQGIEAHNIWFEDSKLTPDEVSTVKNILEDRGVFKW